MTDLLLPFVVLAIIAYCSYRYIPAPLGFILAAVCGLIFLVRYLLPLL